jgi:peroxiredoxin Q/BCP
MKIKKTYILVIAFLMMPIINKAQNPINFELTSVTDSSHFVLSEAKGKFVVLHFLLKTECPYCLKHTHDYIIRSTTLPNVIQVFIKPDTEKEIEEWAGKLLDDESTKYPIYRDPEANLAKLYNIPDGYSFHGQTVHYPALIVLDTEGNELFRYIGKNNTDRFSFDQLGDKMKEFTELKSMKK